MNTVIYIVDYSGDKTIAIGVIVPTLVITIVVISSDLLQHFDLLR